MNTIDIGPMNSFQAEALIADLEKTKVLFEVLSVDTQDILSRSNIFGQVMSSNLVLVRMEQDNFTKHLSLLEKHGFNLLTKVSDPPELQDENLPILEKKAKLSKPEFLESYFDALSSLFWILLILNFTELRHNQYFKISFGLVVAANFGLWLIRLSKKTFRL